MSKKLLIKGIPIWQHNFPLANAPREMLVTDGIIEGLGFQVGEISTSGADVIQLQEGVILPAFFDAHLHLDQGGRFLEKLQLHKFQDSSRVLSEIEKYAAGYAYGEWVSGIGLHENAIPLLRDLHAVLPNNPLMLYTRDYHTLFVNQAGLARLGINQTSIPPEGGHIEKDQDGHPNGIFRENAVTWIESLLPEESEEELEAHLLRAIHHLRSLGILGVSDAGHQDNWEILKKLDNSGNLPIRVESWFRCLDLSERCLEAPKGESENLRRSRIKIFLDGALGSRTAWMKGEYADLTGEKGRLIPDESTLRQFCADATRKGWSLVVHAIGDAAVEFGVELLGNLPAPAGRHRLEHVQHITPKTLEKFQSSSIIPSIQPLHRIDDLGMLVNRIGGERSNLSFPMKSLLKENGSLALGTDFPVVSADPRHTLAAALRNRGRGEGMPGEELTIQQAIQAYTKNAVEAAGFNNFGDLSVGRDADFIWFPTFNIEDPDEWLEVKVGSVWRKGELVYQDNDLDIL
ncbi:amidohydrolase [bacterium]|nr:amidohydrolase [bacterium]